MNELRNPHVGAAVHRRRRTPSPPRSTTCRVPGAAVLARAHDGRPVVDPRRVRCRACRAPWTCRAASTPTSTPTSGDRAVPAIAAYRDGGCVPHELPPDVLVEMMAFLAGTPVDEDVMVPMFVEDMQFDGADGGTITWGDEMPDDGEGGVAGRGDRRRPVRASSPASACRQAGLPFTIVDKNEGPGGTWWENRVPRRPRRRRQPPVLLPVRARAPLERVLLPAARAARLLRPRRSRSTGCVRTAASAPTVTGAHVGRADGSWHVGSATPTATTETLEARFVISAVGSLNLPQAARHPRHGRLRGAVVPLGALARRSRPHRHAASRSSAPARAGSRSPRPSPTRSRS